MSYAEALARLRTLKGPASRPDRTDDSLPASVGFGSPADGPYANPSGAKACATGAPRAPGMAASERVARHEEPGGGASSRIRQGAADGTDKTDGSAPDATSIGAPPRPSTNVRAVGRSGPAGILTAGTAGAAAGAGWGAAAWRKFLDERTATAEMAGRVDGATAARWAYEACVTRWLDRNPPPDDPTRCAYSGEALPPDGGDAVPVLRGGGGHLWVRRCHLERWRARRRAAAVAALAALGVRAP